MNIAGYIFFSGSGFSFDDHRHVRRGHFKGKFHGPFDLFALTHDKRPFRILDVPSFRSGFVRFFKESFYQHQQFLLLDWLGNVIVSSHLHEFHCHSHVCIGGHYHERNMWIQGTNFLKQFKTAGIRKTKIAKNKVKTDFLKKVKRALPGKRNFCVKLMILKMFFQQPANEAVVIYDQYFIHPYKVLLCFF